MAEYLCIFSRISTIFCAFSSVMRRLSAISFAQAVLMLTCLRDLVSSAVVCVFDEDFTVVCFAVVDLDETVSCFDAAVFLVGLDFLDCLLCLVQAKQGSISFGL